MSFAVIDNQPYAFIRSETVLLGVFLTQVFYVGRDFTKGSVGALINLFSLQKLTSFCHQNNHRIARIEMQQGSSASSMTKTQSLKERTCFSILKSTDRVEEAWARPVSHTDQ